MSKTIKDIVSVKSEAALVKGVQLNWYGDPQQEKENRRLATGYIFSSGKGSPDARRLSAISIFERVRESLNQPTSHNVFTVVAKYGHGKSHFALVLANYFGRFPGDEVLEGLLQQIEACSNPSTAYHFRSFKENLPKPQLVICLSGADFTDLRQGFMQAVRRALQTHEQARSYAIKSVSLRAAEWLKSLSAEQKVTAQNYLVERHRLELETLIQALNQFDLSMEGVAREVSKVVLGVPADFGADLNLRETITQLVDDLCTAKDAPFSKMVILFDELGIYAEKWCYNKMAAGGLAPQQIVEACDSRRGRVCLVGFLQREMSEFVKQSPMQEELKKWAERFPTETCFSLEASLEKVIEGLLTKSNEGKGLIRDYMPHIERACDAAWRILPYYQERSDVWNESNFRSTVGVGSFPFHPITSGLLCNLGFVQGERTIIGFVDESIQKVSDQPAVREGTLNWVPPTSLVDEFRNNFEGHADHYSLYSHAQKRLGHNVDSDFHLILKALFLFDVGKLKRYPSQTHECVLAHLCGLSPDRVRGLLKELEDDYYVIRFLQARKEYEFVGIGTSPIEIRQQTQNEITGKSITNPAQRLSALNILQQVVLPESEASGFKAEHGIEGDEWRLFPSLLDARKLEVGTVRRLLSELESKGAERGLLICVVSSDGVELDNAKGAARQLLDEIRCSGHPSPIVIAVPRTPAVGLEREILMRDALNSWGEEKRKLYGEGFAQAVKDADRRLEDALRAHLKDLEYVVSTVVDQRLKVGEGDRLDRVADRLFESCYPSRVPGRSNIMKTTSSSGNAAVADIGRHLILNELDYGKLDRKAQNLVTAVLTEGPDKWGILNSKYRLQKPANPHVLKSWEEIERKINENVPVSLKLISTTLRSIPYGHDDFTLTLLYAAWIGMNKNALAFTGRLGAKEDNPRRLTLQEIQSQVKKAKDFIRWLDSGDVQLHRPGLRDRQRAEQYLQLIKQTRGLDRARSLIGQANGILEGIAPEEQLAKEVTQAITGLSAETQKADRYLGDLQKYNQAIDSTGDLPGLLHLADNPPQKPQSFLEFGDEQYVQAKKSIENKVLSLVEKLTQTPLKDIEGYDALRGELQTCQAALERSGREDLKQKCIAALARTEDRYALLKTEQQERTIVAEVNALNIEELGLASCRRAVNALTSRLANDLAKSSDDTRNLIRSRLQRLESRINDYTKWVGTLPERFSEAQNLRHFQKLRDDIASKEQHYSGTAELETVQKWKHKVVEEERAFLQAEAREASRKAVAGAFIAIVKRHATRLASSRLFKDAIAEYDGLINARPSDEGTELNETELRELEIVRKNARDRMSLLFADFRKERPLRSATDYERRRTEIEEVRTAISRITGLPGDWGTEVEALLKKVNQDYEDWRAERERFEAEQKRIAEEEQRRLSNLKVLKDLLRQTGPAQTFREINNAVARIDAARAELEPPCDEEFAELTRERARLNECEFELRRWVSDRLPPSLLTCWDLKGIRDLRKAIVEHESLCASDVDIRSVLSQAHVELDQRTQLLNELSRIEMQCNSLDQCDGSLARLAELKEEYPNGALLINRVENEIKGRSESLRAEARREIEKWVSQFKDVSASAMSATQASDLLRKLGSPPASLDHEEEVFIESVRKELNIVRDTDLAHRITDDFARLQTPEQRGQCLLTIAEICKREGLLSEHIGRLRQLLGLE